MHFPVYDIIMNGFHRYDVLIVGAVISVVDEAARCNVLHALGPTE